MTLQLVAGSVLLALLQAANSPAVPASAPGAPAAPASAPDLPTPKDANERMKLAEKVNGLEGLDVPWHLKATWEILGLDGKPVDTGTYEEWRASDQRYRIAFHSPNVSSETFGTDQGVFVTGQHRPARPLSKIPSLLAQPVPAPSSPEGTKFENYDEKAGFKEQPCTAVRIAGSHAEDKDDTSYCFAATNAVVLYASTPDKTEQTLFKTIVQVHGHNLAKQMQLFILGRPWLNLHVETFEGLSPRGLQEALVVPESASKETMRIFADGTMPGGKPIKRVVPSYPAKAKLAGIQGRVILNGVIGTDGHVKELHVLAGPALLQQPAFDAVQQWEYTPYLLDGKPVEVETDLNVIFNLAG